MTNVNFFIKDYIHYKKLILRDRWNEVYYVSGKYSISLKVSLNSWVKEQFTKIIGDVVSSSIE
jgi:hypothetical protein